MAGHLTGHPGEAGNPGIGRDLLPVDFTVFYAVLSSSQRTDQFYLVSDITQCEMIKLCVFV